MMEPRSVLAVTYERIVMRRSPARIVSRSCGTTQQERYRMQTLSALPRSNAPKPVGRKRVSTAATHY